MGEQQKYFQVITRQGEIDVKVKALVMPIPQLQHLNSEIKVLKPGVYKVPLRCDTQAEFSLNLIQKSEFLQLKKDKIAFQGNKPKAALLWIKQVKNLPQDVLLQAKHIELTYQFKIRLI